MFGYGGASAEVLLGELRDGDVHHESAVEALDHAAQHEHQASGVQGEHGHEDEGEHPEHGPDHEHGTAGDHCTHTHSAGLPGTLTDFGFVSCVGSFAAAPAPTLQGVPAAALYHPPRA